jgi:hypothetical protein
MAVPPDPEDRLGPADWMQSALASIGAATIVTDAQGRVVHMNPLAESLTGWPQGEALGQPVASVFRLENEWTRRPVANPAAEVPASRGAVGLSNPIVLISRDRREWAVADWPTVVGRCHEQIERESSRAQSGADWRPMRCRFDV